MCITVSEKMTNDQHCKWPSKLFMLIHQQTAVVKSWSKRCAKNANTTWNVKTGLIFLVWQVWKWQVWEWQVYLTAYVCKIKVVTLKLVIFKLVWPKIHSHMDMCNLQIWVFLTIWLQSAMLDREIPCQRFFFSKQVLNTQFFGLKIDKTK